MKIDIQDHMLVPKHEVMTEEEISDEFGDVDYNIKDLPKIKSGDPVVKALNEERKNDGLPKIESGNVLRITRDSQTAGKFVTYRIVED